MKRTALTLLLALSAFAAHASDDARTTNTQKTVVPETRLVTAADAEPRTVVDGNCIRETGTKLKRRDRNGCTGAAGQAYSRADIDRSGATDTAGAIRKLHTGGRVH